MPRITGDVIPKSKLFPMADPERQERAILPLRKRMSLAAEKLEGIKKKESEEVSPKTIREIGRVVLEMEKVNGNLEAIEKRVALDIKAKKELFDKEKKLIKDEEEEVKNLRVGLFDLRSKIALIAGAAAFKSFSEGKVGQGFQNLGVAGLSMAPEILEKGAGFGLGALGLRGIMGGAKQNVGANPTPLTGTTNNIGRSKMKLPRLRGRAGVALGATALLGGLALGGAPADAAEDRLTELTRRETGQSLIAEPDVERFNGLIDKFSAILDRFIPINKKESADKLNDENADLRGRQIGTPYQISQSTPQVPFVDEKTSLEELGITQEQYNALKQGVADVEGARYNQMGGSSMAFAGRYQMGRPEIDSASRIIGITPPTTQEYLNNPELQERIYMGRTLYMHRQMLKLSPKYRQMGPVERVKMLGAGQLGEGNLQRLIERGEVFRDGFNTPITKFSDAVERRLNQIDKVDLGDRGSVGDPLSSAVAMRPVETPLNNLQNIVDSFDNAMDGQATGSGDPIVLQLPGQTKVVSPKKAGPRSPDIVASSKFSGSFDHFTSNAILGVG
tara:strand:+ start:4995 stop:6677 length:1683 start_codon:yes stop_codon:yes gene_type:complete